MSTESWDVLHSPSAPSQHWTTVNVGESLPGVQTPLSLYTWQRSVSTALNAAGRAIGVFTASDGFDGPCLQPFYGRAAMPVEFLKLLAERMPGVDPSQVVEGFIGEVPAGLTFAPTRRFYPNVLRRYPVAFVRLPPRIRALAAFMDRWWPAFVARVARADPDDERHARALLSEALEHQSRAAVMQTVSVFAAVQPVHDALVRTIEHVGAGNVSHLTAPIGGAEALVIKDLWEASRGRIGVSAVVARHGFHGPNEGELSSRVWREDDRPVVRMVEQYAALGEDEAPARREARTRAARDAAAAELLAAASPRLRPAVRAVLATGERRLPLRGVGKRSMVQGLDAVRAAARHLGEILARADAIAAPDDIFYLTLDEITGPVPDDARELIALRRARRESYTRYTLPTHWSGEPEPRVRQGADAARDDTVQGVGVSGGIVEGDARVVEDPSFSDVEGGEILVAPTTDPSWASIMFVSAALVVDIGGELSHAAVVARELGIPCVVNTRVGTTVIRTGDRLRVDGDRGTVEVLHTAV